MILIFEANPLWKINDILSNKVIIIIFSIFLLVLTAWVQTALNNATFKSTGLKYVNYILLIVLVIFTLVKFFIPAAQMMKEATPQDVFTQYKQEKADIRELDLTVTQKQLQYEQLQKNKIKDLNRISKQSQRFKSRIKSEKKPNLSSRRKSGTWASIRSRIWSSRIEPS